MLRPLRFGLIVLPALALVSSGLTPARGAFDPTVTVQVTQESPGLVLFDYTLTNPADSMAPVSAFQLDVSPLANLSSLSSHQTGFDISYFPGDANAPGDIAVIFTSGSAATDIKPGSSGEFSFLSEAGPAPGAFSIQHLDATNTILDQSLGQVLTPTGAVPEPSSLLLCALGALGLLGYRRRFRRKPAA